MADAPRFRLTTNRISVTPLRTGAPTEGPSLELVRSDQDDLTEVYEHGELAGTLPADLDVVLAVASGVDADDDSPDAIVQRVARSGQAFFGGLFSDEP